MPRSADAGSRWNPAAAISNRRRAGYRAPSTRRYLVRSADLVHRHAGIIDAERRHPVECVAPRNRRACAARRALACATIARRARRDRSVAVRCRDALQRSRHRLAAEELAGKRARPCGENARRIPAHAEAPWPRAPISGRRSADRVAIARSRWRVRRGRKMAMRRNAATARPIRRPRPGSSPLPAALRNGRQSCIARRRRRRRARPSVEADELRAVP